MDQHISSWNKNISREILQWPIKPQEARGMCTEKLFPVSHSTRGDKYLIKSTDSRLQISRSKCLSTRVVAEPQTLVPDGGVVRRVYMSLEKRLSRHMKVKSDKGFEIKRCSSVCI